MSELRITSPKLLIANMEQEISNFLDDASVALCDLRHRAASPNAPSIYNVLVYNSYTEKAEDGLGRLMLLPAVVMANKSPAGKRIFRKGSLTVRGNNRIDTYQLLEPTIRQHYQLKFDSEFDFDIHCQTSIVFLNSLTRLYELAPVPNRYLVSRPIYDKVITGF